MVMAMGEGGVKAQLAKPSLSKLILNLAEPHFPPTFHNFNVYIFIFYFRNSYQQQPYLHLKRWWSQSLTYISGSSVTSSWSRVQYKFLHSYSLGCKISEAEILDDVLVMHSGKQSVLQYKALGKQCAGIWWKL